MFRSSSDPDRDRTAVLMRSVVCDRYQLALAPAPELRPEITPGNLLPEIDPEPNNVIADIREERYMGEQKSSAKPFGISKQEVWEAYRSSYSRGLIACW